MKKLQLNPLELDKETIASLDAKQLQVVLGGAGMGECGSGSSCLSGCSSSGSGGGSTGCGAGSSQCRVITAY